MCVCLCLGEPGAQSCCPRVFQGISRPIIWLAEGSQLCQFKLYGPLESWVWLPELSWVLISFLGMTFPSHFYSLRLSAQLNVST